MHWFFKKQKHVLKVFKSKLLGLGNYIYCVNDDEWENPNNKNYLVKTIRLKLNYVIYGYTTLFIANLICLASIPTADLIIYIPPRVDAHCQLLSLVVHWSYWKKTTHACNVKCGGLCQRIMETTSEYYCTYRCISGIQ